jgi:uncharacterized protein YjbI with pentapeptide repeats
MKTFTRQELDKIIDNHKLWLSSGGEKGERANLSSANLSSANLSYADLRSANLSSANLSYANLSYADLRYADLRSANLRYADLRSADLSYANLSSADLDYSAFPLWCGGLDVHIDDKQATQLLYHLVRNVQYSKNTSATLKRICKIKSIVKQANKFHRVDECGKIEE